MELWIIIKLVLIAVLFLLTLRYGTVGFLQSLNQKQHGQALLFLAAVVIVILAMYYGFNHLLNNFNGSFLDEILKFKV